MKKNRHNAIIHCGFQDGTVGLYSPNHVKGSVVTFQALREPINDIAIDNGGRYVACAGMGKKVGIYSVFKNEIFENDGLFFQKNVEFGQK